MIFGAFWKIFSFKNRGVTYEDRGGRATATTSFTALKHVSQLGILAKILQETSKNVIFQKGGGK